MGRKTMTRHTWLHACYKVIKIRECHGNQILPAEMLGKPVYYEIRNSMPPKAVVNIIGTVPEINNHIEMIMKSSHRSYNSIAGWGDNFDIKYGEPIYTDVVPLPDPDYKKP
jgi:hypothetical protein